MVDEYNEQSYESCVCKSCSIAVLVPKFIRWWWNPEFGHLVHLACFYLLCNSLINQHQIQNHTLKHFYWQAASAAAPLLAFVTVFFWHNNWQRHIWNYEYERDWEENNHLSSRQAGSSVCIITITITISLLLLLLLLIYIYIYIVLYGR